MNLHHFKITFVIRVLNEIDVSATELGGEQALMSAISSPVIVEREVDLYPSERYRLRRSGRDDDHIAENPAWL